MRWSWAKTRRGFQPSRKGRWTACTPRSPITPISPQQRACRLIGLQRSSYYYRQRRDPQTELRVRLKDLAGARVRYGYRRLHILLQREGRAINHKRVYRLYRQEGLTLRLKTRKKRVSTARVSLPPASAPNQSWSMDFMMDRLVNKHGISRIKAALIAVGRMPLLAKTYPAPNSR